MAADQAVGRAGAPNPSPPGSSPPDSARLDVVLGLVVLLICGAVLWGSIGLPDSPYEPLGPASLPRAVAVVIAILAITVLVQGLRHLPADTARGPAEAGGSVGLAVGAYALTILFIVAMSVGVVGYQIGSVLYVFALGALLTRGRPRALAVVAALALILGLGTHYVFTTNFVVDLP